MKPKKLEKCDILSKTERRTQHEKVVEEDQRKSVHDEFFCDGIYGLCRKYPLCMDWSSAEDAG